MSFMNNVNSTRALRLLVFALLLIAGIISLLITDNHLDEKVMKIKSKLSRNTTLHKRLYTCGVPMEHIAQLLFPDYNYMGDYNHNSNQALSSSSQDVMVAGMTKCVAKEQFFKGETLFLNCEPFGSIFDLPDARVEHLYQIGSVQDGLPHAMRGFCGAMVLVSDFPTQIQSWILDPTQKRHAWRKKIEKNSTTNNKTRGYQTITTTTTTTPREGLQNAVIYMARNCVRHRQKAAAALSRILPVHIGGFCAPKKNNGTANGTNILPSVERDKYGTRQARAHWQNNYNLYAQYKYCLCMENTNQVGYISEKIIMAFLGGCLPIYYGTSEVMEVFNPRAFIYYDIDNPQIALERIQQLQRNDTEYRRIMIEEPILLNGTQTVRDFFSFADNIGGGKLKAKIRQMMLHHREDNNKNRSNDSNSHLKKHR